jgi:uncharacterized membrane protein YfcA
VSPAAFGLSLLVGAVAGTASGLLGIGGGVLVVPFLYFLMGSSGWSGLEIPLDSQAALAHATSLAVIVPTALSGFIAFRRMGLVPWSTVFPLGVAAAIAALVGARVAIVLPTPALKAAFGAFLLVSAVRLLASRVPPADASGIRAPMGKARAGIGGGAIGFLSALLGVGGGIVAVPILLQWGKLELDRAVPASIAIILFAAPAGVLSYALADSSDAGLTGWTIGYVQISAALAMIPGAVAFAPLGARLNRRLGSGIRPVFAILLLLVGAQLLWVNATRVLGGP